MAQAFDRVADSYDTWYDSPEGRAIFTAELTCLRQLCAQCRGRWLEVGVGSGRFAANLGIAEGIDPSPRMVEIAVGRGVRTHQGYAEALPFPDRSLDGALLALALCFVADAEQALRECFRVLRPDGGLLLGIIPAESPWGKAYRKRAAEGHPVYAHARFRTVSETVAVAESTGFKLRDAASTLFWPPGAHPETNPRVQTGVVAEAGFVALSFTKPGRQSARERGSGWDQ